MRPFFLRALFCLPTLTLLPAICHADPVQLGVGGNLYGEFSLGVNKTVSDSFVLNQNTQIASWSVGVQPDNGSSFYSYEVTLSGPQGTFFMEAGSSGGSTPPAELTTPLPSELLAGTYTLNFIGGACTGNCLGPDAFAAGIDYYFPAQYTNVGGAMTSGSYGFTLNGQAVPGVAPEPGSYLFLLTGLAGLPASSLLRKLRRPYTRSTV